MVDLKEEVEHKSDDELVDIKDKKKGKKGKKDKEDTEIEEDFSTEVTSRLTRILKDPDICDVTFIVGKEKEEIHSVRAHLACQSDYFRAMFFGKMQESLEDHPKITLPEFSPRPFKVFLSFIHTGRIKFNSKEEGLISDLLKLADHFDVPHLFSACYRITEKKIDENNVLELLLVAERYNDKKLFEHALSFIMKHAETLFQKPEFVNSLTAHNFIEFLSKDELAATEITLFQSVLIWGKHKKETGDSKADFAEIVKEPMSKIRFALIPAKKLMEVVRPTGFIDKKTLMNILAYQADKKHFTAEKLGLNIQRRFRVLYGSGAVSAEAVSRKTTFSPGPAAGYHNTHDGGLAVLAGKLWAHYGNDGAQGNRVWVVDIETAERTQINLPWGTHGSYPATDFQKYIYLYEDSDSAHGNGFGRIDIENSEFEALAPVPGAHCRYSSGCVQGGCFWKLASGTMLHSYSIDENKWESKGVTLSSQAIVMADPTDEDFIWFMVQGGSLRKYSISGNSFEDKASRPSGFSLGANYSAIILPRVDDETGEVGGIIICAFQSGNGWQIYDSGKNTWAPLSWPDIMEGGHTAYDFGSQTVYLQVNNQSTFQKVCYGED